MENENNKILYWIWLSLVFPYGNGKLQKILSKYNNPYDFYNSTESELKKLELLSSKEISAVKHTSLKRAEKIITDCENNSIKISCYGDENYPEQLKLIYGPPVVLYYKGDMSILKDNLCITVVGTRRATDYSSYTTQYLSYNLAKTGTIVISGCAVGIDTDAHIGALKASGKTVAVLACGIDVNYPSENKELKERILEKGGALISELPPGEQATPYVFPIRNRILAGLANGVLVTHAPQKSGSLITAEHAVEQGKEVFCVPPYSIFDQSFSGVNRYLRDGAVPVFSPEDILSMYYASYSHKLKALDVKGDYVEIKLTDGRQEKVSSVRKPPKNRPETEKDLEKEQEKLREENKKIVNNFDEDEIKVYNNLNIVPKSVDELAEECELGVGKILSVLTEFEIMEIAQSVGGRRYKLFQK